MTGKSRSRPAGESSSIMTGLCPQFYGLRDGSFPVGDGDRHDAVLTHEARDIGRNAVVAEQYDTIRRRLGVTEWLFRMLPETVS